MGMGPPKCFLHVAVMGALLAVGTTEGECGRVDMDKCAFGFAHLLWFFPYQWEIPATLQASFTHLI